MKVKFTIAAVCMSILMVSCSKEKANTNAENTQSTTNKRTVTTYSGFAHRDDSDQGNSRFIPIDVANQMINSYVYSTNNTVGQVDVKSFIVNADSLRAYLADPNVKSVKLMFAHTQEYIAAGNAGQYAGLQTGAITMVMVGFDNLGNYIYHNGMVLDHLAPCPFSCPQGSAGSDALQ